MDKTVDVLLQILDKQWLQAKQSEDQRATMTNLIIIVAIGLEGLVVQRGFDRNSLALAVVIVLLGFYGVIVSAKYYERFKLSTHRIKKIVEMLDEIAENSQACALDEAAEEEHRKQYPVLTQVRLHHLWLLLHLCIALFGIITDRCI